MWKFQFHISEYCLDIHTKRTKLFTYMSCIGKHEDNCFYVNDKQTYPLT